MKNIILSCLTIGLMFTNTFAQVGDDLVTNGSFEEIEGKIKKAGSIAVAVGWISPTKTGADLYSTRIKDGFGIPANLNGVEETYDGSNYAGFSAFSYGGKEARSYVSSRLIVPMRKGQRYCVKFYVSLSEASKYATNNVAINFSRKQYNIDADKHIIDESHVTRLGNPILNSFFGWEEVCGTFIAEGGEKFLTIGNFSTDGNTLSERMKKPSTFRGAQKVRAYYFVDNISVEMVDDESDCECLTDSEEEEASFEYEVAPINPEGMTDALIFKYSKVYFGYNQSELTLNGLSHLKNILNVLKANPNSKVKVISHMDAVEAGDVDAKGVDVTRGENIRKYLNSKGISSSRIIVENKGATMPGSKVESEIGQAKSRRVTFVLM